jgi:DnaJ-class molecular chaperone
MFMERICPRCNGSGEEPTSWFLTIMTFGLWLFIEHAWLEANCKRCKGHGFVRYSRRRSF